MALRIHGAILLLLLAACARSADTWHAEIADPDTEPFERGLAAIALGEAKDASLDGVPSALLGTLDQPIVSLAPAARSVLLDLPPAALPELCGCLVNGFFAGDLAQRGVEEAIVRHGATAVPALLDAMPESSTAAGQRVGRVVIAIGEPAVAPLVLNLRPGERGARAAFLLGALGRRAANATDALIAAASDPDRALALAAIDSLPRVNPEGWRVEPALRTRLAGTDPDFRGAAEESLARILLERARKLDPVAGAKKRLALLQEALRLGDRSAEAFAEGLWPEGSSAARFSTDAILGSALRWSIAPRAPAPSEDEVRRAEKELGGGPFRGRRAAALTLGRMGREGADAIPALGRALDSTDWGLRFCASLALALIAVDFGRALACARGQAL